MEKNINLSISSKLETELIKNGSSVILTREDDYDLSSPNTKQRKRSDFKNIKSIFIAFVETFDKE